MEITNNTIPEFDFDEFDDIIIDDVTAPVEATKDENVDTATPDTDNVDTLEVDVDYGAKGEATAIAFIQDLKDQGIFSDEEMKTFDGSWESAQALTQSIPQKAVNNIIAEAPDLTKQLLRYAFTVGNDINKESLTTFMKTYLEEIDDAAPSPIETMDAAKAFLETYYKEQGEKPSTIKRLIDGLEDDDELLETAQEKFEKQKAKSVASKSEAMIAEVENAKIQREQSQREFVSKISQEIESTGWKPTRLEQVRKTLAGNNMNTILSEVASNPKTLVQLADFLSYYSSKDKTIDYTAFMRQGETTAVKSLKDRVEGAINSPTISTRTISTNKNNVPDDAVPVID